MKLGSCSFKHTSTFPETILLLSAVFPFFELQIPEELLQGTWTLTTYYIEIMYIKHINVIYLFIVYLQTKHMYNCYLMCFDGEDAGSI